MTRDGASTTIVSAPANPARGQFADSFFFQAEDGIRGHCMTGVQTCALPICITGDFLRRAFYAATLTRCPRDCIDRKERRVGKECRSGRSRSHHINMAGPRMNALADSRWAGAVDSSWKEHRLTSILFVSRVLR